MAGHQITALLLEIPKESQAATDIFSQPILIKQIGLLLSYCDRFYHRQFLTRKQGGNSFLTVFEGFISGPILL